LAFVPDKPEANPIRLLTVVINLFCNRLGPIRVKHLSGDPLYGMPLGLPTNLRLGLKG